ncbi:TolC family outer membrane protein [uncultured Piscinibacter sp.]|uniref:TolC family outer membrane protein n=1 Tax=uncultured Piscinibacter sp. TaxID=1131835 RepID=UPI00262E4B12|nr:TolC family outer membrane protein [uncultured Piscinibacter sp.]
MHSRPRVICAAISLLLAAGGSVAQNADPLRAAAEKAVATNPEVTARFNAYRSATDAVDAARGGFLPRVDLNASVGRDEDRITGRLPDETQSLNRSQFGLSLTQLLWDGLGTRKDVDRLTHDRLARYFELLEATEQTVLEAARAHYDVRRFRRLVQLAEDNYVQHRYAFLQIQSRVKAGVGRGVDLEQAGARLALAESNLTTELANLHDVTARYQRVVGELPPAQLPTLAMLMPGVPASAGDAVTTSLRNSPAVSASIEALRAARAQTGARESAFQPRVEARLRSAAGRHVDGMQDRKRNGSAEIVLSWNLYNGGSDTARVRQQVGLMNQAADLRDRVCRDARQVAAIAYNDTRKLTEQLVYLERNTLAIEKARDAYRQQFDIGQRGLLDLLNAENEVYTARRAYANAEHDLALAYARTHAAMNRLSTTLGIARTDRDAEEAAGWTAGDDAPDRCPVAVVGELGASDRAALDARAEGLSRNAPTPR